MEYGVELHSCKFGKYVKRMQQKAINHKWLCVFESTKN